MAIEFVDTAGGRWSVYRAKRCRPGVHTHRVSDGTVWVGGQVLRHEGADAIANFYPPQSIGERSIPLAMLAAAGCSMDLGCPVIVRFDATFTTGLEVRGGRWAGMGPGSDEIGSVARGDRYFSILGEAELGHGDYYDD